MGYHLIVNLFSVNVQSFLLFKYYKGGINMKKNIFLYVYGDDYSALRFLDKYNTKEVYDSMVTEGVTHKILTEIEDDDEYCIEVDIKKFGEVDPKFISFIKNELCDCDHLNHCDIYKVEL
jgi:hypothetical protein